MATHERVAGGIAHEEFVRERLSGAEEAWIARQLEAAPALRDEPRRRIEQILAYGRDQTSDSLDARAC